MDWISVTDRFPDIPPGGERVKYLVTYEQHDGPAVGAASWVKPVHSRRPLPARWEEFGSLRVFRQVVTHWAPLPEPATTPPPPGS